LKPNLMECNKTPYYLSCCRCGSIFKCCLLRWGWHWTFLLQVNSRCILVGCRYHDHRRLWWHDVWWSTQFYRP